jgi:AcrR family transcriptional regulator
MTDESNELLAETAGQAETDGRRGQRRKDREAAIVAAAIEEFRAAGLTNARLDDIASRAGVAKGTLYLYFDCKEDLFKAATRSLIQPVFEQMEQQVATFQGPTSELLRLAILQMYADMAARPEARELMRLLIAESHRMPDLGEFYYREVVSRGLATMRMIIWRGIALGEFRQSPAAEFPQLVLAPCIFSAIWDMLFGPAQPLDLERYAGAHVEFILSALRPIATP